jgi:methylenetetrahydrofolate reductase (NADPH)
MGRISIELVPRYKERFIQELKQVQSHFSCVDTINIPDIVRYDIRSLQGAKFARPLFPHPIPHLRAIAVSKNSPLPYKDFLLDNNIGEVLVIRGDKPLSGFEQSSPCNSIDLIKKFKKEIPQVKVYAGIDQYRSSFREECEYIQKKIDAGADGFFTQPFFDLKLMERYAKKLNRQEIFWGLSPVTTERSKAYWENNNKVSFPPHFRTTLEWNRAFAQEVLKFTKKNNFHIYFMPIKNDVVEYLKGII